MKGINITIKRKKEAIMRKNKLIILDNGSHMGFLYRPEFLTDLKKTIEEFKIRLKKVIIST